MMTATRGLDLNDRKMDSDKESSKGKDKVATDGEDNHETERLTDTGKPVEKEETVETLPTQVREEEENKSDRPAFTTRTGTGTAEPILFSDNTDLEPLLGFEPPTALRGEVQTATAKFGQQNISEEAQELMDYSAVPTRKRKGEPVSPSSLSDGKIVSDNADPDARPARPTNERGRNMPDETREETPLGSDTLDNAPVNSRDKFWRDPEETLTATSSSEDCEDLKGSRKRLGNLKKKKKGSEQGKRKGGWEGDGSRLP